MGEVHLANYLDLSQEPEVKAWNSPAGIIDLIIFHASLDYSSSNYYTMGKSFSLTINIPLFNSFLARAQRADGTWVTSGVNASGDDFSMTWNNGSYTWRIGPTDGSFGNTGYSKIVGSYSPSKNNAQIPYLVVIQFDNNTCIKASDLSTVGVDDIAVTVPSGNKPGQIKAIHEPVYVTITDFAFLGSEKFCKEAAEYITPIVTGANLIDAGSVDPDDEDDDDGNNDNNDGYTPDTPDVPNSPPLFTLHAVSDTALNGVMQKVYDSAGLLASIKNFFGTGVTITPSSLLESIVGCIQIGFKGISEITTSDINLGFYDTEVSAPVIGQFAYFTYGELTIPTKSYSTDVNSGKANFYSADGHRSVYIHIPFCGIHQLDPSEVFGKTLRLTGMVSTTTGQVTTYLSVVEDSGTKLIGTYSGNAGISLPITSLDSSNITSGIISAGLSVAVGVATGGIGGAITGAGAMSAAQLTGAENSTLEAMNITQVASQQASAIGTIGNGIGSAVQNAIQPPSVPHSGGLGGGATANDIQVAYVMIEDISVVGRGSGFRDTLGLPSGKSGKLSALTNTGDYAQISAVNLGISGATSEEIEYTKQLLVSGVII